MDGGAWKAAVHGVAEGWTWLSDFTFTFHFHALEKEMASHSSVLAWRIPGTGHLGGLPSMGSHRVGHDWSDSAAPAANTKHFCVLETLNISMCLVFYTHLLTFPWSRKWQPTPVFLPGESHGQRSLAGYSPWGYKESDTIEWLTLLT